MKFFGARAEAAAWADGLLRAEQGDYRSLIVHDAGNITLVLDTVLDTAAGGSSRCRTNPSATKPRCCVLSRRSTCADKLPLCSSILTSFQAG